MPTHPRASKSVVQAKKSARDLLKDLKSARAVRALPAAKRFAALRRFAEFTPEQILERKAEITNRLALAVLAAEAGFESWDAFVEAHQPAATEKVRVIVRDPWLGLVGNKHGESVFRGATREDLLKTIATEYVGSHLHEFDNPSAEMEEDAAKFGLLPPDYDPENDPEYDGGSLVGVIVQRLIGAGRYEEAISFYFDHVELEWCDIQPPEKADEVVEPASSSSVPAQVRSVAVAPWTIVVHHKHGTDLCQGATEQAAYESLALYARASIESLFLLPDAFVGDAAELVGPGGTPTAENVTAALRRLFDEGKYHELIDWYFRLNDRESYEIFPPAPNLAAEFVPRSEAQPEKVVVREPYEILIRWPGTEGERRGLTMLHADTEEGCQARLFGFMRDQLGPDPIPMSDDARKIIDHMNRGEHAQAVEHFFRVSGFSYLIKEPAQPRSLPTPQEAAFAEIARVAKLTRFQAACLLAMAVGKETNAAGALASVPREAAERQIFRTATLLGTVAIHETAQGHCAPEVIEAADQAIARLFPELPDSAPRAETPEAADPEIVAMAQDVVAALDRERRAAAEREIHNHDFGGTTTFKHWEHGEEYLDNPDLWAMSVTVDEQGGEFAEYAMGRIYDVRFYVQFKPGTAQVVDAYETN